MHTCHVHNTHTHTCSMLNAQRLLLRYSYSYTITGSIATALLLYCCYTSCMHMHIVQWVMDNAGKALSGWPGRLALLSPQLLSPNINLNSWS